MSCEAHGQLNALEYISSNVHHVAEVCLMAVAVASLPPYPLPSHPVPSALPGHRNGYLYSAFKN